jgi:hypothetical protein
MQGWLVYVDFLLTCLYRTITEYIFSRGVEENRGSVTAFTAGAYTTTSLVMVDRVKREGACTPLPPSPGWADFTIMMECMPESGNCHSVYSVVDRVKGRAPPTFHQAGLILPL